MHLRTLLNAVYPHKGFVYENESLDHATGCVSVTIRARKGSRPTCSRCGTTGSTYDHLTERAFDMVPIWGLAVVFLYV